MELFQVFDLIDKNNHLPDSRCLKSYGLGGQTDYLPPTRGPALFLREIIAALLGMVVGHCYQLELSVLRQNKLLPNGVWLRHKSCYRSLISFDPPLLMGGIFRHSPQLLQILIDLLQE